MSKNVNEFKSLTHDVIQKNHSLIDLPNRAYLPGVRQKINPMGHFEANVY